MGLPPSSRSSEEEEEEASSLGKSSMAVFDGSRSQLYGVTYSTQGDGVVRDKWIQTALNELCFWTLSIVWCLKNKLN
jgi:hypothetical protein